jgi:hypothetical protein
MEMRCGQTRDGAPVVRSVTGAWVCMRAADIGLVSGAKGPHQPEVAGYVAHGIWVGPKNQREFSQAKPGKSGGTIWYPRDQAEGPMDAFEDGGGAGGGKGAGGGTKTVELDAAAQAAMEERQRERDAQQAEADRRSLAGSKQIWDGARAGENAKALHAYLNARHIATEMLYQSRLPACLRYAPVLKYKAESDPELAKNDPDDGKPGPGMLAKITNPDGSFGGLHRTYLALDGSPAKRKTGTQRRNSSNTLKPGAAIRLHDNPHSDELWVGEGIETMLAVLVALAAAAGGHAPELPSVYAMLSTSGLQNLELPTDLVYQIARTPITRIVWAADLDEVKRRAGKGAELPRANWRRPGVHAAIVSAQRMAEAHPDIERLIALPKPAWLPELLAEGEYDALGELLPKADGNKRKSVDADDALAAIAVRMNDPIAAARHLGEGLLAGMEPIEAVAERVKEAGKDLARAEAMGTRTEGGQGEGKEPNGQMTNGQRGGDGGAGSAGGAGGDGGDGEGGRGDRFRMMPACNLARARMVLDENFRPGGAWPRGMGEHVFDPTNSWEMRERAADAGERWTLCFWGAMQQWLIYEGGAYKPIDDDTLNARVRNFLAKFWSKPKRGDPSPCAITGRAVEDVIRAMQVECTLQDPVLPAWAPATFDDRGRPLWNTIERSPTAKGFRAIATRGGLIEYERLFDATPRIVQHELTPRYVAMAVLPHQLPVAEIQAALDADPQGEDRLVPLAEKYAPTFLEAVKAQTVANADEQWHTTLQRFGGLIISDMMDYGVGLMFMGVSGGGKGMFAEGLLTCHDETTYATANYAQVTDKFVAASWVGKNVLWLDEFQAGRHDDKAGTASTLKRIIIGSPIYVDIKHKTAISSFRHRLRVMISTDRMPELIDPAAAMRRRLCVLPVRKLYRGAEDKTYQQRVKGEGLGILIWSLGGLRDLKKHGQVGMPEGGRNILHRMSRNMSRPYAFLQDCCVEDPGSAVDADLMDEIYGRWCRRQRCEVPSVDKIFEGLAAVVDGLHQTPMEDWMAMRGIVPTATTRPVTPDGRPRKVYAGVRLRLSRDAAQEQAQNLEGMLPSGLVIDKGTALVETVDQEWKLDLQGLAAMEIEPEPQGREKGQT